MEWMYYFLIGSILGISNDKFIPLDRQMQSLNFNH